MKIWSLLFVLLCTGCSLTRHLPEGEYLYTGAEVQIEKTDKQIDVKKLETTCKTLIQSPRPNRKMLGIRWKLRWYNFFYTKKQKGLWHWLQKKLGEPPVIYDEQVTSKTIQLLQNRAFNQGFFHSTTTLHAKQKKRKTKVVYSVKVAAPYLLKSLTNGLTDSFLRERVEAIRGKSLLRIGQSYNLERLRQERERITLALRGEGFYFFRSDYLTFRADTSRSNNAVQLELTLKEGVDSTHLLPRRIGRIGVYPDAGLRERNKMSADTLFYEGLQIIAFARQLRPATLRDAITLTTGSLYSPKDHQATLERLAFLKTFQFIDVQFLPSSESDALLDVAIRLTPRKRNTVEGSVGGSVKAGLYAGPELALGFINRNLFRGAEQLRLTFNGNYNYPLVSDIASRIEQKVTMEMSKPGLIVPFKNKWWREGLIAQTKLSFSFAGDRIRIPLIGTQAFLLEEGFSRLAERLEADTSFSPFVAINNYELGLSYQWRKRLDVQHELRPIHVVWQAPRYEELELRRLLLLVYALDRENSGGGLLLNLEQMLIFKPGYVIQHDSRLARLKRHNFFYRGKLGFLGNQLLGDSQLIPGNRLQGQFLQLENDGRYYHRFSRKHTLAWRLSAKFSIPFRNEVLLPFFDLYGVGGPNSIRSFQPRRVGPGSTPPSDQTFFFTGTGNVLLEGSMEWRVKLTQLFELGFFADGGNVWLLKGRNGDDDLARFEWDGFLRQLALGTGFGLRLDFDVLLIRMDLGWPLTKPWLPQGDRWVGNELKLRDGVFNLGFGYSF